MTLTEFLLARIAEDEAECGGGDEPENWCDRATGVHHSPARVLAECEAKRQIVAWHRESPDRTCFECSARNVDEWPCRTLQAFAAIYADHPDYRDEWRL